MTITFGILFELLILILSGGKTTQVLIIHLRQIIIGFSLHLLPQVNCVFVVDFLPLVLSLRLVLDRVQLCKLLKSSLVRG